MTRSANKSDKKTRPEVRARKRRSSSEIRRLVRESALELFSLHGYNGTSTRAVAEGAGVTEQMLFRHYRSKRDLFREVIWAPFEEILKQYSELAAKYAGRGGVRERAGSYVRTLQSHLRRDRRFFRAFLMSVQSEPELRKLIARPGSPLLAFFDTLARYTTLSRAELRHGLDVDIAVRITFSYIMSMIVFDDIFFSPRNRPNANHLLREMSIYMMDGIGRH